MNFEDLKDKRVSLIVWNREKENDVHVYLGRILSENNEYYFTNQEKGWRVSLNEEQLARLKPVPDDLRETLLNADYSLSTTVGSLPGFDNAGYHSTGMNWH